MQRVVPFSIAVALPSYRKSLVERMLHGLQPSASADFAWVITDAPDADVTLRAADANDISPSLVAEVRRPDGSVEAVRIDAPWRAGALFATMQQIARTLRPEPVAPSALDPLAWQWLARWCELAASGTRSIEWRIGHRTIAIADPRACTWTCYGAVESDPEELLAAMARDGYSLAATSATMPATARQLPLKPLLWQFGVRSGSRGPLRTLASPGLLKLKGWPYLAAGGPRSFAELIAQLRSGAHDAASLCALAVAPPALVHGFLNACHVCDFFHDVHIVAAATADDGALPTGVARLGAVVVQSKERHVISSIRRVLQVDRP
ncbi:MAG TPA: hypothetical protein VM555_07630 [Tahibacter sp.]|nr:hypothetical protein [Tahibacter sp.]